MPPSAFDNNCPPRQWPITGISRAIASRVSVRTSPIQASRHWRSATRPSNKGRRRAPSTWDGSPRSMRRCWYGIFVHAETRRSRPGRLAAARAGAARGGGRGGAQGGRGGGLRQRRDRRGHGPAVARAPGRPGPADRGRRKGEPAHRGRAPHGERGHDAVAPPCGRDRRGLVPGASRAGRRSRRRCSATSTPRAACRSRSRPASPRARSAGIPSASRGSPTSPGTPKACSSATASSTRAGSGRCSRSATACPTRPGRCAG